MNVNILIIIIAIPDISSRPTALWAAALADRAQVKVELAGTEAAEGKTKEEAEDKDTAAEASEGRDVEAEARHQAKLVVAATYCSVSFLV